MIENVNIAFAIDRSGDVGGTPYNPHVCLVPKGLSSQDALDYVYRDIMPECVALGDDPPRYDYIWYGSFDANGAFSGGECTEEYGSITPWSERRIEQAVKEIVAEGK